MNVHKPWLGAIASVPNYAKRSIAADLTKNQTVAECTLWKYLRHNRLNGFHFRRQQVICGFIIDFYCQSAKLAIEVDGSIHESQKEYDHQRDDILKQNGIRVIRFTNEAVVNETSSVLNSINSAIANQLRLV